MMIKIGFHCDMRESLYYHSEVYFGWKKIVIRPYVAYVYKVLSRLFQIFINYFEILFAYAANNLILGFIYRPF